MLSTKTTKLQASNYKVGDKGPYRKFFVRLPTEWVNRLGLKKGSPLELELLSQGILIKRREKRNVNKPIRSEPLGG